MVTATGPSNLDGPWSGSASPRAHVERDAGDRAAGEVVAGHQAVAGARAGVAVLFSVGALALGIVAVATGIRVPNRPSAAAPAPGME